MAERTAMPDLIAEAQTTEERFLRQIFVRDQMAEWSKHPLVMARADGVHYWDVARQALPRRPLGHLRRLGRPQQPPRHRGDPPAARHAALLAADARHQPASPCSWPTCSPSWPPATSTTVKFQCGGSRGDRGGDQAGPAVPPAHRQSPGKYKIISRYLSWHGSTLGSLSASGLKGRKTVNEPLAPGFLHVFPPTCYRCPFGKSYPDCGITCATIVERRDRDGRPGHGRGDHGRADRPHRRHHRPADGVPADPARDLRPAQRPADLRRDHHRHRPDRADVRRRDVRRRRPTCSAPPRG